MKDFKIYFVVMTGFIFSSTSVLAGTLSLEEAVQKAQKNSEAILLTLQDLEKNSFQVREAKSAIRPKVSAEARYQRFLKDPVFFTSTFPIKEQFEASVNVSQVLWTFGKISGALEAAKANLQVTQLTKNLSLSEIEYVTKSAYFSCLLAKEQLKVAEGSLQNAKDNLRILQRKFSGGRAPKADLLRLRADVASRKGQVKMSEASYQKAVMGLARLLGLENAQDLSLTTDLQRKSFPSFDSKKVESAAQTDSPRLEVLKAGASLAKAAARVKKADRYPSLVAFGSYLYSGGSQDHLKLNELQDYYFVGLSLKWDIWSGGAQSARFQQAQVDLAKADIEYQRGQKDLVLGLNQALVQYQALQESHQTTKEAVGLARESFKVTQKRYGTGQSSVTEINNAEAALTQAKLQLAAQIFQINTTIAEIENLSMKKRGELQ